MSTPISSLSAYRGSPPKDGCVAPCEVKFRNCRGVGRVRLSKPPDLVVILIQTDLSVSSHHFILVQRCGLGRLSLDNDPLIYVQGGARYACEFVIERGTYFSRSSSLDASPCLEFRPGSRRWKRSGPIFNETQEEVTTKHKEK